MTEKVDERHICLVRTKLKRQISGVTVRHGHHATGIGISSLADETDNVGAFEAIDLNAVGKPPSGLN